MNYRSRYFAPMFWTQFLGAFNDNIYKNALIILISYQSINYSQISPGVLIPLSVGLFILPFFLFSSIAGQLADKYEKSQLIRMIKSLEILIMTLTLIGFYFKNIFFLMAVLFFMGCQSSLFGPVKYSILPQHLNENGLIKANALFGMGTFMAILSGTILGGVLVSLGTEENYYISFVVIFVAILGRLSSQYIPVAHSANKDLKINWNIFTETINIMSRIRQHKLLLGTVLSISWFWFLGATVLTILPGYSKNVLFGEDLVVTLLLAVFTIGVGIGTLIVGQTGVLRKSLKWVVIGTIGISFFSAHLYWNSLYLEHINALSQIAIPYSWQSLFNNTQTLWILFDMMSMGISAGLYIVPLYVVLQEFSEIKTRSRIIAANNITNAFFMVCSAIILLLLNKLPIETIFILLSVSNCFVVSLYYYFFSSEIKKIT